MITHASAEVPGTIHAGNQDWITRLDRADQALIDESFSFVQGADIDSVLAGLVPRLTHQQRSSISVHCTLDHAAGMVFPVSVDTLIGGLRDQGSTVDDAVPSVVVRERLSRRHGMPPDTLNVAIVRVHVPGHSAHSPRMVELFVLEAPPESGLSGIAARERAERNESHLALKVDTRDDVILAGLRRLLVDLGGLEADSGGYNHAEDCTVLYFRNPEGVGANPGSHRYRRLELRVSGYRQEALAEHRAADEPSKRLLELMTGAWTTQAIAVAAELGLADHLSDRGMHFAPVPVPVAELADRLSVHPDGLARLLRYLAAVGLVTPVGDSYTLTALGEPLRRGARHSLRPLALLYGGPFYQSFGALTQAVHTGQEAFQAVFGQGHFNYFAAHPALAELFDAAMAAGAAMFEPVAGLVDFSDTRSVVDVAGGNGELLGRILEHAPHLHGVLFEQAHVLERARQRLAETGLTDRCDFVAGDFTQAMPAGADMYLLSRILHDWDDETCLTILRRCAANSREGTRLLVVERLLTTDGTPSLAVPWDLHMLCNVGGRERTAEHYEQLLAATGFDLISVSALPLDGSLLQARRRAVTGSI